MGEEYKSQSRNIQGLKTNMYKAFSQSCLHCPTLNLSETQHFILTHSNNQQSNATILKFKTYYF